MKPAASDFFELLGPVADRTRLSGEVLDIILSSYWCILEILCVDAGGYLDLFT